MLYDLNWLSQFREWELESFGPEIVTTLGDDQEPRVRTDRTEGIVALEISDASLAFQNDDFGAVY